MSTPAPAPTPAPSPAPPPAPSASQSISALSTDQSFATNSASVDTTFDLTSAVAVTAATPKTAAVTVAYNAASQTYVVSAHGQSQSFGPGAVQSSSQTGETRYQVASGPAKDLLTLVVAPYSGGTANTYVGLGYWQRAQVSGSTQTNTVDIFTYGFNTPGAAVPRAGVGTFATDAFGLLTWPGQEPMVISGAGTFDVDFKSGAFRSTAMIGEYALATWNYTIGGQLVLQSGGTLGSDNSFGGNFSLTDLRGTIGGDIRGSFYGPAAQEFGASFSGSNANGATLTGAMTGQRNPNAQPASLVLANIVNDTPLTGHFMEFNTRSDSARTPALLEAYGAFVIDSGKLTLRQDGTVTVHPVNSLFGEVVLNEASRSSVQKPDFDSYDVMLAATPTNPAAAVHVDLAKRGTGNSQITLTYADYGKWSQSSTTGTQTDVRSYFFTFGFETPQYMLAARAGSATYSGIAQGVSTNADGSLADVSGTSNFNVNFASQTYSGALALTAQAPSGPVSLGTWTFADALVRGLFHQAVLVQSGTAPVPGDIYNLIEPHFYGPDGQEIGAPFSILTGPRGAVGTVAIGGTALAKQN